MSGHCDEFNFDPELPALENFFNLVYRRNKVRLTSDDVTLSVPKPLKDPDGDNTEIKVTFTPQSQVAEGTGDLYYARADINTHYPIFKVDYENIQDINDVDALMDYLDGAFNMVDGEVDLDVCDPLGSLLKYTCVDLVARPESLIYIGRKTIHIFWSKALRRITEDGRVRVTDCGLVRTLEIPMDDSLCN